MTDSPISLFERLDLDKVMEEVKKLNPITAETKEVVTSDNDSVSELKHKEEIDIDEFSKIELRTGIVISCEAVPKSKKLLLFKIKSGNETRQIVSGIHKYYKPEDLVGKTIIFVANLKPAKLAGILSEGMILSAEDDEDHISLVTTERHVKNGAEIR